MKKNLLTLIALGITFLLMSCGGGPVCQVVDAYDNAKSEMKNASSNDEVDEINDRLIENIANILRENKDAISEISTSTDVKKAYKEYWDEVEKAASEDSHWMFISMPQIKYIEKKI